MFPGLSCLLDKLPDFRCCVELLRSTPLDDPSAHQREICVDPKSRNPFGRLRGEKEFAAQLRIVLAEPADKSDPEGVRKLRRIAEKLAECALNGEPWAIAQVA